MAATSLGVRYVRKIAARRPPLRCRWAASTALAAALASIGAPTPAAAVKVHPGSGRFKLPANAHQLIVVSTATYDPPDYLATLAAYERAERSAPWRPVLGPWQAETGYGHLRDHRHEGDGSTPTGVFGIGATIYGNKPEPGGIHYAYRQLVCGDWWDEDPSSRQYNRFLHVRCGATPPFAAWSEALWTETVAYPYFAVLRFNMDPVVGGRDAPGSGIFLHSWVGGPTAGCVALPETRLLAVLRWLRPSAHAVVEIGTAREVGGH
jgi:L,D-peptidoglycan transpeptidase YkuD (ErfK/YbiS/YcfS/YnhG family)